MTASDSRVWLDLLSSLLGVTAGIVIVAAGLVGPLVVGGADIGVAAMGLLGAGFAAVGIGHLQIGDRHRGMGEILAGVGAIFLGISYLMPTEPIPFAIGALGLGIGGAILVAESFGLVGRDDDSA